LSDAEFETVSFSVPTNQEGHSATYEQFVANETPLLLFYRDSMHVITDALAGGQDLDLATKAWIENAVPVLRFVRTNRKSAYLVNLEQVLNAPGHLIEELRQRFAFDLTNSDLASVSESPIEDPILYILAERAVRQAPHTRPILEELEASSLLNSVSLESPAQEAFAAYISLIQGVQDNSAELSGENKLLKLQLQQLVEELETTFLSNEECRSSITAQTCEIETLRKNLNRIRSESEEFKSVVTAQKKKIETLRSDLKRIRNELDERVNDLNNISKTLSWRITAPLRWIFDRFKRGS
jgi:hypothetical protein